MRQYANRYRKPTPRPSRPRIRKDIGNILLDGVLDQLDQAEVERRLRDLSITEAEVAVAMKNFAAIGLGVTL